MVERICPSCRQGNPLDDRYCGKCGAALERLLPAPATQSSLAPYGRNLPVNWQRVGRTVAISAAALAAEVGLAMLKRKLESNSSGAANAMTRAAQQSSSGRAASITTIVSQRIIEIVDAGDGRTQLTDRHFWQRTDE